MLNELNNNKLRKKVDEAILEVLVDPKITKTVVREDNKGYKYLYYIKTYNKKKTDKITNSDIYYTKFEPILCKTYGPSKSNEVGLDKDVKDIVNGYATFSKETIEDYYVKLNIK